MSGRMSLCRLHHAAFDRSFLGVHPDYIIRVRTDVLEEVDGPMLRHGLQGVAGAADYGVKQAGGSAG